MCHYKGQSHVDIVNCNHIQKEASRRPLLFEVEEVDLRRADYDRGIDYRLPESKPRIDYRSRVDYKSRIDYKSSRPEAIDYWSRSEEGSEVEARKEVEVEGDKN